MAIAATVNGKPVTVADVFVYLKANGNFRSAIYDVIEIGSPSESAAASSSSALDWVRCFDSGSCWLAHWPGWRLPFILWSVPGACWPSLGRV